jgi:hypothetical protein
MTCWLVSKPEKKMKRFVVSAFVRKSIKIEESLNKMGWITEVNFSNCEGSHSFYITIGKCIRKGQDDEDFFEKKIRFSDHELPFYYALADSECRFDLNRAAWSNLKPVLAKLYREEK